MFRRLTELRGEVVHVKANRRTTDLDSTSVFGRLLRGDATRCVEDAASVIDACEPGWLPDALTKALGL
jgi:hypothetical protein